MCPGESPSELVRCLHGHIWARRRAREIGGAVQEELAKKVLALPLEKVFGSCWNWYEPHMFRAAVGQLKQRLKFIWLSI